MKIMFIHGRAQQGRSAHAVRDEWLDALNRGMTRIGRPTLGTGDILTPYYGDELVRLSERSADPNSLTRSANPNSLTSSADQAAFMAESATEIIRQKKPDASPSAAQSTPPSAPNTIVRRSRSEDFRSVTDPNTLDRGIQNWPMVVGAVRILDQYFPNVSDSSISLILHDVHAYLTDTGTRKRINEIFKSALASDPDIVVAHSLGTVVAYNLLRTHERTAPRLITLGSPLGIQAVKRRLDPQPITQPQVGSWSNLYDPQDIVALNPLNTASFSKLFSIEDREVRNESDNHHNITPYLSHPETAFAIAKAMDGASR